MERWCNKVAIVTGASAGIGASIAKRLVKCGMTVVGLARRPERVQAISDELTKEDGHTGKLHAVQCDMRIEEDVKRAFEWTTTHLGPVHVLINNAAQMPTTNLIDGDAELWRGMLETNVLGLCVATREAVKCMRANAVQGHIIHMNSLAGHGHYYFPMISVYGATKHAVTNLTETLRKELQVNKIADIKVSSISPGAVDTDIFEYDKMTPDTLQMFKEMPILRPDDVVDAVVFVLSTPHRVHINELIITPTGSVF